MGILSISFLSSIFYFFFYFFLSVCIFYFFYITGLGRLSQVSFSGVFFIGVGFLSLGGLPPLRGFVIKIIGIQAMLSDLNLFWVGGFILGSLLSLYYYLNFVFVLFLSENFV